MKKAFSAAAQSFNSAKAQGDEYIALSSSMDEINACTNWTTFSNQFKKVKECINNDNNLCWDMTGEKSNLAPNNSGYGFIDSAGMSWSIRANCISPGASNTITIFLVDTNGLKGPNQFGKDRWTLGWQLDSGSYPTTPIGVKLYSYQDYTSVSVNYCRTPPCYYKTWLYDQ